MEGRRADVAMGALVNVLKAVILQANPSIEDAMEVQLTLSSRPLMARGLRPAFGFAKIPTRVRV